MLTVDDLRQHITSDLSDEALERLLGAAYESIDEVAGPSGNVTELLPAGPGPILMLSRAASSIVSVTEYALSASARVLAVDDYAIRGDQTLVRLDTGTNPSTRWRGPVDITYSLRTDEATRDQAAISLVKLELDYTPGLVSQSLGAWSETYAQGSGSGYTEQRAAILAALAPTSPMIL